MSQYALLRKRRFLPFFITQFLGAFNDNVFKNALIIFITYQAGRSAGVELNTLVNLCAGLFILPFFLFSAFAGQVADKFEELEENAGIASKLEPQLREVKAALERIDKGTYGLCEKCSKCKI